MVEYVIEDKPLGLLPLKITANVKPDIAFVPSSIEFDEGSSDERSISFAAGELSDFELSSVSSSHRALQPSLDSVKKTLRVKFDAAVWDGEEVSPAVSVLTSSVRQPLIRIPVGIVKRMQIE
jgi:hypothetical protein